MSRRYPGSSVSGIEATESAQHGLLRIFTCGSVDDGKSTLLGRMLYDSKRILSDEFRSLKKDSNKFGTTGEEVDLALLVDGLEAEREQGITIDVAYRYFATDRRSFIVADTPGHEQYTCNMVTGASTAELAIVLVDARKGLLPQTFRHSIICDLLGIRHVVLAVNKMDLVGFDEAVFKKICDDYLDFAKALNFTSIVPVPIAARFGDNVAAPGARMAWYGGPSLLECLETVEVASGLEKKPFRLPVQWINRPNPDFRGICGTVSSGRVRQGDMVVAVNSGLTSRIDRIVSFGGDKEAAVAGEAVTLVLTDDIDIGRGHVLAEPNDRPEFANQFTAKIVWMSQTALFPGRPYLARIGNRFIPATITNLKHRIDIATLKPLAARTLGLNDIGECNIETAEPVVFEPYSENRDTGSLILIDRATNATVGAGMILHGLRRAQNVHHQHFTIGKVERSRSKSQKPCILWFTGLSGSGKSTIANLVEQHLHLAGHHTMLLDGDNFRHGLSKDLGFTQADRVENIRRSGEVARLMIDAGLIVLCCFISPFKSERELVRSLVDGDEFIEVFVDAPLDVCIKRDPKGLYRKALSGEIPNFTGISAPYEVPEPPDLILRTADIAASALVDHLIEFLRERQIIA
jgi:bifunctional enzyme CysN/CysC